MGVSMSDAELRALLADRPDLGADGVDTPARPTGNNVLRGAQAQKAGADGEDEAERLLEALGVKMVDDKPTPFAITGRHPQDSDYVRIRYKKKVQGDVGGILPNGCRVLTEVKARNTKKLSWGVLRDHQVESLNENAKWNGLSLIVWIAPHGSYVMQWPIDENDWCKGTPLTRDVALQNLWDGVEI